MSEPLKVTKSRAEMIEHARQWMTKTYGVPKEMDSIDRDAWHGSLGMLVDFIAEVFPE